MKFEVRTEQDKLIVRLDGWDYDVKQLAISTDLLRADNSTLRSDIIYLKEEKKKLEVECKNSEDKVEQITIINARLCQQYNDIKNMEVFREIDRLNAELKKLNSMNSIKQHIALEERNAELEGRIRQFESYVQSAIDDLQTSLS